MRTVGRVALVFSLVCLAVSAFSLRSRTTVSDCVGTSCTSWDCGSLLSPRGSTELRQDAAERGFSFRGRDIAGDRVGTECARQRPDSRPFFGVLLAGLGLVVVAVTSWRPRPRASGAEPSPVAT
jgi:hypothetical protein